jgi:hypothetical protein
MLNKSALAIALLARTQTDAFVGPSQPRSSTARAVQGSGQDVVVAAIRKEVKENVSEARASDRAERERDGEGLNGEREDTRAMASFCR